MTVFLDISDSGTSGRTVRHMIRKMMESEGIAENDVSDVELILGELCSNVERHGRSERGRYRLELSTYPKRMTIKIVDNGKGFDFASLPDPNANSMELAGTERDDEFGDVRLGGWGIPTVQSLATTVQYVKTIPTGTTVFVEKRITYSDSSQSDFSLPEPDRLFDFYVPSDRIIESTISLSPFSFLQPEILKPTFSAI